MQMMWCWRCRQDMPMLDEAEYKQVARIYQQCAMDAKKSGTIMEALFMPVTAEYQRLTGMEGVHHNAVMHHRAALYGDPCERCGKPLRTPAARLCAACGWKKGSPGDKAPSEPGT